MKKILCKLGKHNFKPYAEAAITCMLPDNKGYSSDQGFLCVCTHCGTLQMESKYSGIVYFTPKTMDMMFKNMGVVKYLQ